MMHTLHHPLFFWGGPGVAGVPVVLRLFSLVILRELRSGIELRLE